MRAKTGNTIEAKIAHLLQIGKSYSFICTNLQTSPKRVSRVNKSLKNENRIPPPLKLGQPLKVNPEVISYIRNETEENPRLGSSSLSNKMSKELEVSLSSCLISRIRRRIGYVYTHPRKRQALSQKQIENRIKFCEENIKKFEKWRRNFIITDESRFGMYPDSSHLWLQRGNYNERTFVSFEKFYPTIMVWGGIGYNYKSKLIIIESTLDSEGYINMLKENNIIEDIKTKIKDRTMSFQQDGAPAHNAKKTKEYIRSEIELIDDWPANSPDLSVIENLWAIIKKKLKVNPPQSLNELKNRLIEEWDKIDQETINKLMEEYPARFRLCIKEKGKSISRILHKIKEFNNENIPSLEELESIGILIPGNLNELLINKDIIIAGVCLTIQETIFPNYFTTKLMDHPFHINNELPKEVRLMIPENLVHNFKGGHYYCISGRFRSQYYFYKDNLENAETFNIDSFKYSYIIEVKGID